jgi:hypothetical protein
MSKLCAVDLIRWLNVGESRRLGILYFRAAGFVYEKRIEIPLNLYTKPSAAQYILCFRRFQIEP